MELVLLIALPFGIWMFLQYGNNVGNGKVVRIEDANIAVVQNDSGKEETVHLAGIEAPDREQADGPYAQEQLAKLIAGKRLRVDPKVQSPNGRGRSRGLRMLPGSGRFLFLGGMYPYVLRPDNVFQEHLLNGLNDLAFGLMIPWVREVLENKRIIPTVTLACGVLPVTLILADVMVMRYCQLDSLLVWVAFLGFVAVPPKWLTDPPRSLWWLGKYSLTVYGVSFLPFLLKWYPTGFPAG